MIKLFSSVEDAFETIGNGKIQLFILNGRKVIVTRFKNDLFAFDNNCPHQNEPMHKGVITKYGEIVCPLHFYRFDLKSGKEFSNRCEGMNRYPIITNSEGVFIRV